MPISVVADSGEWTPIANLSVSNGRGRWAPVKSVKRSDGEGNWAATWVPLSSVTVTGSLQSLSPQSGSAGAITPKVVPPTFAVILGKPESVATVELQKSFGDDGAWATIKVWNAPTEGTLSHPHVVGTAGIWWIRAIATLLDGRVVTSHPHHITCYTKNLIAYTSNPVPAPFEQFTLSAVCDPECLPGPVSAAWFWRSVSPRGVGPWYPYGSGTSLSTNPQTVWQETAEPYEWTHQETFADGSTISSSPVLVTSRAT